MQSMGMAFLFDRASMKLFELCNAPLSYLEFLQEAAVGSMPAGWPLVVHVRPSSSLPHSMDKQDAYFVVVYMIHAGSQLGGMVSQCTEAWASLRCRGLDLSLSIREA